MKVGSIGKLSQRIKVSQTNQLFFNGLSITDILKHHHTTTTGTRAIFDYFITKFNVEGISQGGDPTFFMSIRVLYLIK